MMPNSTRGHSFGFIRFWIVLSSIFGMIVAVMLAGLYFYYLSKYNSQEYIFNDSNNIAPIFLMKSYADLASYKVIFLFIIIFTFFTTIICNIGLIEYATRSTDSELCANKWVLAVLSLSIGGFFTPFALTWLPDTNVQATKNARVVLVRYLGTSWMLGSLVSFIAMWAFYGSATEKIWASNEKNIFIGIMIILALVTVISAIFVVPFYSHRVDNYFAADSSKGLYYRFVATVYTVIATILLVIQILTCILKVVEAIGRVFQRDQNGFEIFFAIMNAFLAIISAWFMIYLITKVIKGLWKSDDGYRINIPQYKENQEPVYR